MILEFAHYWINQESLLRFSLFRASCGMQKSALICQRPHLLHLFGFVTHFSPTPVHLQKIISAGVNFTPINCWLAWGWQDGWWEKGPLWRACFGHQGISWWWQLLWGKSGTFAFSMLNEFRHLLQYHLRSWTMWNCYLGLRCLLHWTG